MFQALICRSALETQKLELMAEISSLKLKLTAVEKERIDFDERFRDSEVVYLAVYQITTSTSHILKY